jgi:hypothetical protein
MQALKTSLKTTYPRGTIYLSRPVPLSRFALAELKIMGGFPRFRAIYGDYYVAGLNLGADTSVLLSQSSNSKTTTEVLSVNAKVHTLWFDKTKKWDKVMETIDAHASYTVTGFDTLSNRHVKLSSALSASVRDVRNMCLELSELGKGLQERVEKKLRELNINESTPLSWVDCDRVCRSGLVVGIILMPFATVQEYVEWGVDRDII